MRDEIVIIFLTLISFICLFFVFRSLARTVSTWQKDASEWVKRKKAAARLLGEMENKPRERLVEIALALALSPYHWPHRMTQKDHRLVQARERHLATFTSLSDKDLRQWIKETVQDTHSLLLKVALESLTLPRRLNGQPCTCCGVHSQTCGKLIAQS